MHASSQVQETIVRLVPGGEYKLSHLADDELLTGTRRLVGASNKVFAQLLLHLAEVETRGIHRTCACASLYTYCIYELRMSEDAAARRSSAARLLKRFPLLFDAIASGELHLTGLLMLGPHLTPENHVEVLARAKFRTKKEIAKLVRELHPLPRVPDLVQPLGPELPRSPRKPTLNEWITSLCPPVRELAPGESPRDWADDGTTAEASAEAGTAAEASVEAGTTAEASAEAEAGARLGEALVTGVDEQFTALARRPISPITSPQQYQMQFCTNEEHVRLVERARALLAHSAPSVSLGDLHLQAMQLLVDRIETKKFAVTERSRKAKHQTARHQVLAERSAPVDQCGPGKWLAPTQVEIASLPKPSEPASAAPRQRAGADLAKSAGAIVAPRQRARHVPAAVKREVFARDAGCCSYVDERGQRCGETRYLELHHLMPFARGGEHVASNLALRCTAHNALAAEADFGRRVIEQKRHPTRHDSLSALQRP